MDVTDTAIAAGSSMKFRLKGDLSDCGVTASNPGSRIGFSISAGTNFNWDDDVSTSVATTQTQSFPVEGSTFSF